MADTKKKGVFSKISSFFRASVGEIKKITWPTAAQTTKNFGIVVLVILVAGLFIYGLDRGLYALLNLVMSTGTQ
ncbi:MAG: preprotein translocase subunit SecE [Ruminococcus sp.]|nr:preprotein translocase subunit SecE [Ruminococcus sp.]